MIEYGKKMTIFDAIETLELYDLYDDEFKGGSAGRDEEDGAFGQTEDKMFKIKD